jgi:hypothetical protein
VDFDEFCLEKSIHVQRRIGLDTEAGVEIIDDPNLNADLAIYLISREKNPADSSTIENGAGI